MLVWGAYLTAHSGCDTHGPHIEWRRARVTVAGPQGSRAAEIHTRIPAEMEGTGEIDQRPLLGSCSGRRAELKLS